MKDDFVSRQGSCVQSVTCVFASVFVTEMFSKSCEVVNGASLSSASDQVEGIVTERREVQPFQLNTTKMPFRRLYGVVEVKPIDKERNAVGRRCRHEFVKIKNP